MWVFLIATQNKQEWRRVWVPPFWRHSSNPLSVYRNYWWSFKFTSAHTCTDFFSFETRNYIEVRYCLGETILYPGVCIYYTALIVAVVGKLRKCAQGRDSPLRRRSARGRRREAAAASSPWFSRRSRSPRRERRSPLCARSRTLWMYARDVLVPKPGTAAECQSHNRLTRHGAGWFSRQEWGDTGTQSHLAAAATSPFNQPSTAPKLKYFPKITKDERFRIPKSLIDCR